MKGPVPPFIALACRDEVSPAILTVQEVLKHFPDELKYGFVPSFGADALSLREIG